MADDDEYDFSNQQARNEAPAAGGGDSTSNAIGPVIVMWENALEKLKILNYEEHFCRDGRKGQFHRLSFVYPGGNASAQFQDFVDVAAWLADLVGGPDPFKPDKFDDPNTISNKLLLSLRAMDFRSSFPPQKLKQGSGLPCCSVLDFMTDKAL